MTDVRLDRTVDGRCTLFVGGMLVFSDLTEAQATELASAFGGTVQHPSRKAHAPPPVVGRHVGGRGGCTLPRTAASHASENQLRRLR